MRDVPNAPSFDLEEVHEGRRGPRTWGKGKWIFSSLVICVSRSKTPRISELLFRYVIIRCIIGFGYVRDSSVLLPTHCPHEPLEESTPPVLLPTRLWGYRSSSVSMFLDPISVRSVSLTYHVSGAPSLCKRNSLFIFRSPHLPTLLPLHTTS